MLADSNPFVARPCHALTAPCMPLRRAPAGQEAAAQQAVAALLAAKAGNLWSLPLLQRAGSPAAHSPSITTTTVTAEGLVSSRQSTPGRDPLPVAQAETGVIRCGPCPN